MSLSLRDHLSAAGIQKWIKELSVTDAPVPRDGVRTALAFFERHMSSLPPSAALEFLRATDLSNPVTARLLSAGEKVIA